MGEENTTQQTATPPAASGGITQEQLDTAVSAAVAAATKPLTDKITQLESVKPAPAGVSADDVTKLLDQREAAKATSARVSAAKSKIVKEKLNGIDRLAGLLPDTDDEAELGKAADELAKQINLSAPKPNVSGGTGDGGTTPAAQPVDKSKIDPVSRIVMGMK